MNSAATVYVVDDDSAVRDALVMLLEQHGMRVVACQSAAALLQSVPPDAPGCAVIDVRMPGMDGLELQEQMGQRGFLLPVVILTGHGDIPMSVKAIRRGAVNFLTKPVAAATLVQAVREALDEGERMHREAGAIQSAGARLASLTAREQEVMALALQGLPNKEMARLLGISHRTVEIHRARLMHKTGVQTLLELARLVEATQQRP
jgi:FixJ family two-component response regulator